VAQLLLQVFGVEYLNGGLRRAKWRKRAFLQLWSLGLEFSPAKSPNLQANLQVIHRVIHLPLKPRIFGLLAVRPLNY
jgi:hypothetical protein